LSAEDSVLGQRIDQWLWHARRFPSRSAAARFVEDGGVRLFRDGVSQRIARASFRVRPQDEIAYLQGDKVVALRVLGCAKRRGPAAEAAQLYLLLPVSLPPDKA
jgi:ribosome-associated heat shock protein Hsp15